MQAEQDMWQLASLSHWLCEQCSCHHLALVHGPTVLQSLAMQLYPLLTLTTAPPEFTFSLQAEHFLLAKGKRSFEITSATSARAHLPVLALRVHHVAAARCSGEDYLMPSCLMMSIKAGAQHSPS